MLPLVLGPVAKKRRLTGTLSDRLRALLDEQGRDVTWLAEEVGIHRVSMSRIVNGKVTDPAVSIVKAAAAALGVTVGELVDEPPSG